MEAIVHVVGAGIAGLSAAVRLASAGRKVIVHEATGAAGGRCRSYFDAALGRQIDNGNHLVLSGNRSTLDYLKTIGATGKLVGPDEAVFDFIDLQSGERWRLHPNAGRIPWWLLDPRRRTPGSRLLDYFAPLSILSAPKDATVGARMRCAGPLHERLWRPILLSALNTEPAESSAALASTLLRETLGAGGRACRPLVARDGLSAALVDPAVEFIEKSGGTVRFGERLVGIRFGEDRALGLDFEGAHLILGRNDKVVLATPPWISRTLIPGLSAPTEFRGIVNAHFLIDPPREAPLLLGVINAKTQWIFAYPGRVSVTISAAEDLIDRSREKLADAIWLEVATALGLPAAQKPASRIVKERRATFAATPAENAKRPSSKTRWRNLALAGDWVQTGLPATIEGAVRSGVEAASILLSSRKTSEDPVADLSA